MRKRPKFKSICNTKGLLNHLDLPLYFRFRNAKRCSVDLANLREHTSEPTLAGIKSFVASDALEFDRSDRHALGILILSHASGDTVDRRSNTDFGAPVDQVLIEGVGGGTAGKISRLLHQGLLSAHILGKVLGEIRSWIHLVQLDVPKGITRDLLARLLELRHNILDARTLAHEDIDTALFIHHLLEAGTLALDIDGELRDPNGMDVARLGCGGEGRHKGLLLEGLAVVLGSGGGQVSAVASHNLMKNEHARVGGTLGHYILKEDGTLLSGSVGTKGLVDGKDVIVNGLGHADDGDLSAVLLKEVLGQLSGLGVGIITANGVDDVHFVLKELLRRNLEGRFAFLAQTALDAVGDVGQLRQG